VLSEPFFPNMVYILLFLVFVFVKKEKKKKKFLMQISKHENKHGSEERLTLSLQFDFQLLTHFHSVNQNGSLLRGLQYSHRILYCLNTDSVTFKRLGSVCFQNPSESISYNNQSMLKRVVLEKKVQSDGIYLKLFSNIVFNVTFHIKVNLMHPC